MKLRLGRISAVLITASTLGVGLSAYGGGDPGGASISHLASSGSTPASQAAQAKQALQPFLKVPTTLALNTPLPKAPPGGGTVVFLQCNDPSCSLDAKGIAAAATLLHWTFKAIPFQLAAPFDVDLRYGQRAGFNPKFVIETGIPPAAYAGEIQKYKAAGVGIVVANGGNFTFNKTMLGATNAESYDATATKMLMSWLIADSAVKVM